MIRALWIALINGAIFVGNAVVVALSNSQKLGPYSTSYWSDLYANMFTPPGWMFALAWTVIYALIAATIISIAFAELGPGLPIDLVGILIGVSSVLNALWIVLWSYGDLTVDLFVIVALLIIIQYLDVVVFKAVNQLSTIVYYTWRATFGAYSGWLTLATLLNLTVVLQKAGSSFVAEVTWATIWICVVGVYSIILFGIVLRSGGASLIVTVALIAIASKYKATDAVFYSSLIFALLILITWIVAVLKNRGTK